MKIEAFLHQVRLVQQKDFDDLTIIGEYSKVELEAFENGRIIDFDIVSHYCNMLDINLQDAMIIHVSRDTRYTKRVMERYELLS